MKRGLIPLVIGIGLALLPPPDGLAQHAWYFFAIFCAVVAGLIAEPIPSQAVAFTGVTLVTVLAKWALFSPAELAKPGFNWTSAAVNWGLSGFGNSTVWLVVGAFIFALGYEKTGLGRRIALLLVRAMGRTTLMLGYAVAASDAVLAPFTPSNSARSGGIIFPIVRNLPDLYGSKPNDPSSRKIGGYVMWVAFATGAVTSSLFLTALTPNILGIEIIRKTVHVEISWMQWFLASAPFALPLLLLLPLLAYWIYPPEIKRSPEVVDWAREELAKMGGLSGREVTLIALVVGAVLLWMFGADFINATTVALAAIALMLVAGVFKWEDVAANRQAWSTLVLLGSLITLSDGLARTGFVKWFADTVATHLAGFSPTTALVLLTTIYFLSHYMFASTTAHAAALLQVMLAVGLSIPGMPIAQLAMVLALTHGIMSVISPYATGPAPVYYGAGYLPTKDFWRLGAIFGAIFLGALLVIGVPLILAQR
ncbi:MAG: anion permease [Betaproteobacteria bacterium]|nr:anion permease [Betaproteobacteria bacterium]